MSVAGRGITGQAALLGGVGLAGWISVWWLNLSPIGEQFLRPVLLSHEFATVFALTVISRLLSFRAFGRVRVALDSAYYVVTAFVCGVLSAAALAITVLTTDGVARCASGTGALRPDERSWLRVQAQLFSSGGLAGFVLLAVGVSFGDLSIGDVSDFDLLWMVPTFSASFVCIHYALTGGGHWLRGNHISGFRGHLLRVIGAEVMFVPLALAMVLAYRHQGLGLLALLGVTGLFTAAMFKRVVTMGEKLERRVDELSTLNEVGQVISGSLKREELVNNIATATLHMVGSTSLFMIGLFEDGSTELDCQYFDASGNRFLTCSLVPDGGTVGWVIRERDALLVGDRERSGDEICGSIQCECQTKLPTFRSWIGAPIVACERVIGVLALQSAEPEAYGRESLQVIRTIADQAAVALENAHHYELATIDGLTRLFVRRYFDRRIVEEWERSDRFGNPFVLGLLDLDNFKALNDRYGHQAGDTVLTATAAVVRHSMRSFDLAARYGGEEFAFILPRTDLDEARSVAERIRRDIEKSSVVVGSQVIKITASIGISAYPEIGIASTHQLVAAADAALYDAKRAGKNRVVVATPCETITNDHHEIEVRAANVG